MHDDRDTVCARHKRWRDNKNELLDHETEKKKIIDRLRSRNRRPTDNRLNQNKIDGKII